VQFKWHVATFVEFYHSHDDVRFILGY
jgi:hypothetical protein